MTRPGELQGVLYAPIEELEGWFDAARAGESAIYARGPALNPKHPVPMLVRDWIATGEALATQKRDPVTRELQYYVRRCRPKPMVDAPRRVAIDEAMRDTPEGKIFLALVRAANVGAPCPSNGELAQVAGLRDADAARYVLYEKLMKPGRIEILPTAGTRGGRVIRIVETGRVTAEQSGHLVGARA